jgi:hypothetical protein
MFEEPFFPIQTACISDEVSGGSDNTMTGDDDEDWIFIICSSDSSDGTRITCKFCLLSVVSSFSVWYFLESLPCLFLEFCSVRCEWEVKTFASSGEVFRELEDCACENFGMSIGRSFELLSKSTLFCKCELMEICLACVSDENSERSLYGYMS